MKCPARRCTTPGPFANGEALVKHLMADHALKRYAAEKLVGDIVLGRHVTAEPPIEVVDIGEVTLSANGVTTKDPMPTKARKADPANCQVCKRVQAKEGLDAKCKRHGGRSRSTGHPRRGHAPADPFTPPARKQAGKKKPRPPALKGPLTRLRAELVAETDRVLEEITTMRSELLADFDRLGAKMAKALGG